MTGQLHGVSRRKFLESAMAAASLAAEAQAGESWGDWLKRATRRKPKVTVSKQTTYVTGPLLPDGSVDFVAALNEMLGKGVTPENNALVPLLRAFGPKVIDKPIRSAFFKQLEMSELSEQGDYMSSYHTIIKQYAETEDEQRTLYDHFDYVTARPWTDKEFPALGEWIKLNAKSAVLLEQAAKRARYFMPVMNGDSRDSPYVMVRFSVGIEHEGMRFVSARAMRAAGTRDFEAAWRDLILLRRLARTVSSGGLWTNLLVGRGGEWLFAAQATASLLHAAAWPADRVRQARDEFERLPACQSFADVWNSAERILAIGYALELASGKQKFQSFTFGGDAEEQKKKDQLSQRLLIDPRVEWDEVLMLLNESFDKRVALLRMPFGPERRTAIAKRKAEIEQIVRDLGDFDTLESRIDDSPKGKRLLSLYLCNVTLYPDEYLVEDRIEMIQLARAEVDRTVLALAAYRAENRRYPKKVDELAPKYLTKLPRDPFSDQPLVYKRDGAGYRLYSVGPNGRDDGGRNSADPEEQGKWDDEPDPSKLPDDMCVRVPLQ